MRSNIPANVSRETLRDSRAPAPAAGPKRKAGRPKGTKGNGRIRKELRHKGLGGVSAPILPLVAPRWAHPLLVPSRYKGAYGGRGSGKSHFFAELLLAHHVQQPNNFSVCIREFQRTLSQSVKRLLEMKIESLKLSTLFEVQESVIKSRVGTGQIIFQGMQSHTAESIKSLEGYDRVWVEEAQTLSQKSLDLLRPTIRKEKSELWFTWNPREPSNPVDVLLRAEVPPPGTVCVRSNYSDNPWFPDVLKVEMEYDRARDPAKYQHVWLGGYLTNSEARVFTNWKVEDFETPDDVLHNQGADWGFARDPTVLVRCHLVGKKLFVDYEAYRVGCDITDTPALFMTIPESEKWPIVADSARPETISHMRKNGFPRIFPAVKGKGSIEDGIEWLKSYDIFVHPRCRHTIDELSTYSYKTDPNTGFILPVLQDKKNHVIDALRYACEGLRRAARVTKKTPRPFPIANFFQKRYG